MILFPRLALLGVDCAVARGNAHMLQSVRTRVCEMSWVGKGGYVHPYAVIYLYTLTQGSILLLRSRSLPRLLMATFRGSIIMRQREIALELQ